MALNRCIAVGDQAVILAAIVEQVENGFHRHACIAWRPVVVCGLLIALLLASAMPRLWSARLVVARGQS